VGIGARLVFSLTLIVGSGPAGALPFMPLSPFYIENGAIQAVRWRHWGRHWRGYNSRQRYVPYSESPMREEFDPDPGAYGSVSHEWLDPPPLKEPPDHG
jgi:hypothetical protein